MEAHTLDLQMFCHSIIVFWGMWFLVMANVIMITNHKD
jgi:hypothetical protein